MHAPRIAIVVLHYKNLGDTRACLQSLGQIDYPRYSVIVVNNDAPDHGAALKNEFPDITLVQNDENLGFAEGNNVGIRRALSDDRTDAVLILNNDTKVEPDFLSEMAKSLNSPPYQGGDTEGVQMIAGRMMQYDDRSKADNLGVVLMKSGLAFNRLNEKQKLFCPSAGCALYSRELLEATALPPLRTTPEMPSAVSGDPDSGGLGGVGERHQSRRCYFDPLYFAYAEDVDLGFRARLLGFEPAYAKDAVVYHKGSASTSKLSDLAVYHTYRNLIWTQYKNYPLDLFLRNLFWIILGWKLLFLGYLAKGRPGVISRAIFDGVRGLSTMKQKRREIQNKRTAGSQTVRSWFEGGLFPKNLLKN